MLLCIVSRFEQTFQAQSERVGPATQGTQHHPASSQKKADVQHNLLQKNNAQGKQPCGWLRRREMRKRA
jgi:hypothetical protein